MMGKFYIVRYFRVRRQDAPVILSPTAYHFLYPKMLMTLWRLNAGKVGGSACRRALSPAARFFLSNLLIYRPLLSFPFLHENGSFSK